MNVNELEVRQCHLGNSRGTPDLQHTVLKPHAENMSDWLFPRNDPELTDDGEIKSNVSSQLLNVV